MKALLIGILFIFIVGVGGVVYRNAIEHPSRPIVCPMDALVCPDGTSVSRTGNSCTFPVCPPPNVSLQDIDISFALPEGFIAAEIPDSTSVMAYASPVTASTTAQIVIRRYMVATSSTPLETIQQTAINGTSGAPVSVTSFTSTQFGSPEYGFRPFTVVSIERFEGVIDTAYYLKRLNKGDMLRFDAIDQNVLNWTDANLDIKTLPAHAALIKLLSSLQGQ